MPLSDARHAAESNDPQLGLWARRHNIRLRHPLETFSAARPLQDQEEVPKTDDRPTVADGQEELGLQT
jgi:hypothetical protein